jgi:tRNA G18 (ribose-2'-O)-methylase SpoU
MRAAADSLNVASAAAIAFYALTCPAPTETSTATK